MDQDDFRKLLSVPRQAGNRALAASGSDSRRTLAAKASKLTKAEPSQTESASFKPRRVKSNNLSYRDRAAERRSGAAGDFAEVEAVLETFEKQSASISDKSLVEEQRKYLGGDADHTVLVKGLDFALLEQTKAKLAATDSVVDDEVLESAFLEGSSSAPSIPRKRTREDILKELKEKRGKGGAEDASLEEVKQEVVDEAKNNGKFKPIGFKPIGGGGLKGEGEGTRKKKKKRKIEEKTTQESVGDTKQKDKSQSTPAATSSRLPTEAQKEKSKAKSPPPPVDDDFDIFAGAGEYEGLILDDDDDDDESPALQNDGRSNERVNEEAEENGLPARKWFDDDDEEIANNSHDRPNPIPVDSEGKGKASAPPDESGDLNQPEQVELEQPSRLAPLTSSTIPSIQDILAADKALEAEEKRKARKEKRKAGKGGPDGEGEEKKKVSAEAKLNRDFQKLKSYTEKKKNG